MVVKSVSHNQKLLTNSLDGLLMKKCPVCAVEVEDNVLTVSGDKHGFEDDGGKCITRELKHSSFKRSFNLGDHLDGDDVSASFKDGMLSISIPKVEPELPKKKMVKIS